MNETWTRKSLQDTETFIFDCDGVLWRGSESIPGSVETLKHLRALGKRVLFLTNNSTKSREEYLHKFEKLGLPAQKDEIFSSAFASAVYLSKHHPNVRRVLCVGGNGIMHELEELGFVPTNISQLVPKDTHPDDMNAWNAIDSDFGAVVIGLDFELSYARLAYASLVLQENADCILVSTNQDYSYPSSGGRFFPGAGMGVVALEATSGRTAINVGKPERLLYECIQATHPEIKSTSCVMVGDRLDTDILFGTVCELTTCLVLTGVSSRDDIEISDIRPNHVLESIADISFAL